MKKNSGQIMLITVLMISAVFVSATVISGLLMVYQLSRVSKVADSAKAIFAADAGLERSLFRIFRCNFAPPAVGPAVPAGWDMIGYDILCEAVGKSSPVGQPSPAFHNDATYQAAILPSVGADSSQFTSVKVTGRSGNASRAFEL